MRVWGGFGGGSGLDGEDEQLFVVEGERGVFNHIHQEGFGSKVKSAS